MSYLSLFSFSQLSEIDNKASINMLYDWYIMFHSGFIKIQMIVNAVWLLVNAFSHLSFSFQLKNLIYLI